MSIVLYSNLNVTTTILQKVLPTLILWQYYKLVVSLLFGIQNIIEGSNRFTVICNIRIRSSRTFRLPSKDFKLIPAASIFLRKADMLKEPILPFRMPSFRSAAKSSVRSRKERNRILDYGPVGSLHDRGSVAGATDHSRFLQKRTGV